MITVEMPWQAHRRRRATRPAGLLAHVVIGERAGGQTQLAQRIAVQGDALCALAEQLSDDELDQLVPTRLLSNDTVLVDQPIRLRDLVGGLADDHLPRHAQQLLALHANEPFVTRRSSA